jgi:hypothetical protein
MKTMGYRQNIEVSNSMFTSSGRFLENPEIGLDGEQSSICYSHKSFFKDVKFGSFADQNSF